MTVYYRPDFNGNGSSKKLCPFAPTDCYCQKDCALFLERLDDKDPVPHGTCAFTIIAFAINQMRNTSEGL